MTDTALLSRIAETLYWTGRYVERADDTARMVDVYVHRLLEEPRADEDSDCRALLSVLGIPQPPDSPLPPPGANSPRRKLPAAASTRRLAP